MKYSEKKEENSTNTTLQIDKSSQFHEIDPTIQSENTSQSAESELMKDDLEKTSYIDSSQSAELTKPKLKELNLKKSEFDVGNLITCDSSSENGCNSSHHLGILSNPIDEIFLYVISQNDIPKKERDAFLDNTYFHWRSPKDFTSEKALDLTEEKKASKKKIPVVHNTVFEKPNDNEILKIQICPESTIELFNSNNFKIDSSIFYTTSNPDYLIHSQSQFETILEVGLIQDFLLLLRVAVHPKLWVLKKKYFLIVAMAVAKVVVLFLIVVKH